MVREVVPVTSPELYSRCQEARVYTEQERRRVTLSGLKEGKVKYDARDSGSGLSPSSDSSLWAGASEKDVRW